MTTAVADSYITTIEDFEARIGGDQRAAAIALKAADSAIQTTYLQKSTKAIDRLPFIGYKYLDTQALEFPRKFIIDPGQDDPWGRTLPVDEYGYYYQEEVPDIIEDATVEEAIAIYAADTSTSTISEASLQAAGVSSFSLGKLSMSFSPGSASRYGPMKSKEAYDMLVASGYLEMAPLIT